MYRPTWATRKEANVARFAQRLDVRLDDLRAFAVEQPDAFWSAVSATFGPPWLTPYHKVRGSSEPRMREWFVGGFTNLAAWALRADFPDDAPALRWYREDGAALTLTRGELRRAAGWAANRVVETGVQPGDRVALVLSPHWASIALLLGCLGAGAACLNIFSGYGPDAIRERVTAAQPKLLIVQDQTRRRGEVDPIAARLEPVIRDFGSERTVVLQTEDSPTSVATSWPGLESARAVGQRFRPVPVPAGAPAFVLFTSGSTGPPKGVVLSAAGFGHQTASEWRLHLDARPGDNVCWPADLGWVVGPWVLLGVLSSGACLTVLDGTPLDAFGYAAAETHFDIIGGSPSFLSSVIEDSALRPARAPRIIGSAGEPLVPAVSERISERLGRGAAPIINLCGGTEVGTCILAGLPTDTIAPGSFGGPALGMDADVLGDDGQPVRDQPGQLVCRNAWPGRTIEIFNSETGFDGYYQRFGVWCQGDSAVRTSNGQWYVIGRADEVMKIRGRRLGPSEVEAAAVSVAGVTACVSVPVSIHGHSELVCVALASSNERRIEPAQVANAISETLGRPFRPSWVGVLPTFPRTATGKLDRRLVRDQLLAELAGAASMGDAVERLEIWAQRQTGAHESNAKQASTSERRAR